MTGRTLVYAMLGLLLGAGNAAGFAGISVSIRPDTAYVAPDEVFDLVVYVDSVGTPCSGFENTIAWEGVDLEYLSFQPESLLALLSWSEWESPHVYPDSTHIFIAIYPFQGFLDDPGPLYSFTFRARQLGETPVRFSLARFGSAYSGGISPVLTHDGIVYISDPGSDVPDLGPAGLPDLRVAPNPLRSDGRVEFQLPAGSPGRLELFDALGRLLGTAPIEDRGAAHGSEGAIAGAGPSGGSLPWQALCGPATVPAGVYFLRLTGGSRTGTARIVVIR